MNDIRNHVRNPGVIMDSDMNFNTFFVFLPSKNIAKLKSIDLKTKFTHNYKVLPKKQVCRKAKQLRHSAMILKIKSSLLCRMFACFDPAGSLSGHRD